MRITFRIASVWLAFVLAITATAARADASLDAAVGRYEEADFDGALQALTRAETSGLSRGDYLRLLATRALVHFALGQSEPMLRDVAALASLEPGYSLGPRTPPGVRAAFEDARARARGPLSLDASFETTGSGARIVGRVRNDAAGIVARLAVAARVAGQPWRTTTTGTLELVTPPGATVEYWAAALGPGGVELARAGSEAEPLERRAPGGVETGAGGSTWWLWALGGAAIAAAAAVTIVLVVSRDDAAPALGAPVVRWSLGAM